MKHVSRFPRIGDFDVGDEELTIASPEIDRLDDEDVRLSTVVLLKRSRFPHDGGPPVFRQHGFFEMCWIRRGREVCNKPDENTGSLFWSVKILLWLSRPLY